MIQWMLAIWSLVPLPFLKPPWTSGSSRFTYCRSLGWEIFEHCFTSMWDEFSCAVVWAFFGTAFLWDWNENWHFPVPGHCWVFQICWYTECSTFTATSFSIWNSSTGIPFCLFILFMGFSRQEYWSSLPFPSAVDHVLRELSTMTHPFWVALHRMTHSFLWVM